MKSIHFFYMPLQRMTKLVKDLGIDKRASVKHLCNSQQIEGYKDVHLFIHYNDTLPDEIASNLWRSLAFITLVCYS